MNDAPLVAPGRSGRSGPEFRCRAFPIMVPTTSEGVVGDGKIATLGAREIRADADVETDPVPLGDEVDERILPDHALDVLAP